MLGGRSATKMSLPPELRTCWHREVMLERKTSTPSNGAAPDLVASYRKNPET